MKNGPSDVVVLGGGFARPAFGGTALPCRPAVEGDRTRTEGHVDYAFAQLIAGGRQSESEPDAAGRSRSLEGPGDFAQAH
jgi:hypothetical protein